MATVPTLLVGGTDQTDYIQHKTLGFRLKYLDFTLVDPVDEPVLHDAVSLDEPDWHGRVSTIESYPFHTAGGDDHRLVKVTATNKHVAVSDTAPFGLSDTPNMSTTFPFKDLVVIRTLEDQTDLSTAELRMQATIYEPGIVPGMTVPVTCAVESLSAEPVIVTEMTVSWLRDDSPEFRLEFSDTGVPPVTLGGLFDSAGCDCEPFTCEPPSYRVQSFQNVDELACVFPSHTTGQSARSTDYMNLYVDATYRIEYFVFHAAGSNGLAATLATVGGGAIGTAGPAIGGGTPPAVSMGDKHNGCGSGVNDIPYGVTEWLVPFRGLPGDTHPEYWPVNCGLYESSCFSGDSYASSLSTHITWLSGPDPRFETLDPCGGPPHSGRIAPQTFTGDGSNETFTLTWPYMTGSVDVYVDGVNWTDHIIEDDPAAGDFSLAYAPPTGATVLTYYRYP